MRVAYIWASAFWQVAVLAGGAKMTYLDGSGWWIAGAIALVLMGGAGLSKRMDGWSKDGH